MPAFGSFQSLRKPDREHCKCLTSDLGYATRKRSPSLFVAAQTQYILAEKVQSYREFCLQDFSPLTFIFYCMQMLLSGLLGNKSKSGNIYAACEFCIHIGRAPAAKTMQNLQFESTVSMTQANLGYFMTHQCLHCSFK